VTEERVVCAFLWTGTDEGTAYGNGLVKVVKELAGSGLGEGASHALNQMGSNDPDASPAVYLVVDGHDRGTCTRVGIYRRYDGRDRAAWAVDVRD
jgi:hypothetical protein